MSRIGFLRIRREGIVGALLLLLISFLVASPVRAQESLSVTVTPPLFQLTIGPGESWSSSIKVVNNNTYDVVYAPEIVDFEAQGELGKGRFLPLIQDFNGQQQLGTLGSWIKMSREPVLVKSGESLDIPFTVDIPLQAAPGGHYAAILVGPQSDAEALQGSQMKVSSYVTSLMFVRIKGDIRESGRIREFTTALSLYQKPEARFVLRFENTGNTHLRPQGSILIENMWGKKRGEVLINEKSNFGNVLPKSIRKFEFTWTGTENAFDIGRYRAIVTLSFGDESKQNISATAYFWVVPVVPVLITLAIIAAIILSLLWFIRRYIARALELERASRAAHAPQQSATQEPPVTPYSIQTLVRPLRQGVVDLRGGAPHTEVRTATATEVGRESERTQKRSFMAEYKLFFAFIALVVVCVVAGVWYFQRVLVSERAYDISQIERGSEEAQVGEVPSVSE